MTGKLGVEFANFANRPAEIGQMGDVIALRHETAAERRRTPKTEPATILFFTGVRYMRCAEPTAAERSPDEGAKRSTPRRRRAKQRA